MNTRLQLACVFVCLAGVAGAQEVAQAAIPRLATIPLFTIDWNITSNVVHYDARMKDGRMDPKEPVIAYWVMNQTDGHHEGLTLIEKLKAYGFSVKPGSAPDTYEMVIVSVKRKTLRIGRIDDQLRVTTSIGNCASAFLDHVRVQAHKWHLLNIADYADMLGTDMASGAECRERITYNER